MKNIGIIGAGSWGTALAHLLSSKGFNITLWVFEPELCETISSKRVNSLYFPGLTLPENIKPTTSMKEACEDRKIVISVTPSHVTREVMTRAAPFITPDIAVMSATKGIENETLCTIHQVLMEVLPEGCSKKLAVLSGPSFAKEVVKKMPTAVTIASTDDQLAKELQETMTTPYFRVYTSSDVIGVELGGALKNVIAIAAGISDGLGFGSNTRAALITRGLAEINRLAVKTGANPLTLAGLSGIGDLVLTCTGALSRNRTVGMKLGEGKTLSDILSEMRMVAEGVKTTQSAYQLAKKMGVEMPITDQIYQVLYHDKNPKEAVWELMGRKLREELE